MFQLSVTHTVNWNRKSYSNRDWKIFLKFPLNWQLWKTPYHLPKKILLRSSGSNFDFIQKITKIFKRLGKLCIRGTETKTFINLPLLTARKKLVMHFFSQICTFCCRALKIFRKYCTSSLLTWLGLLWRSLPCELLLGRVWWLCASVGDLLEPVEQETAVLKNWQMNIFICAILFKLVICSTGLLADVIPKSLRKH